MNFGNQRVLFLSHGGGPLPLLGDPAHREMVENLRNIATRIAKPSAILVISAHWEEKTATLTSGPAPAIIYDYYGFPEESYEIEYPCPGQPVLAEQVHRLLGEAGIEASLDAQRGFDHGVFVPLKIIYPEADIPCVQLSLVKGLDPTGHISIGRALAGVDHAGLLVVGSGFSFHNMKAFFTPDSDDTKAMNAAFERWLIETLSAAGISETVRAQRLAKWAEAPFARYCHPREEHLLPLHVCYGNAQTACSEYFELEILNKKSSMYLW
jgi:aromatic ring-opening dioxygenase catalytic subunit (LigB family)